MSLEKYNSSKEMLDDYMAYKISTEDNDTSSYSGSYSKKNSGSVLGGIIGAVIVLFVIAAIISAFQPKCAKPGCDNTVEHRDDYCALHDNRSVSSWKYSTPTTSYTYTTTTRSTALTTTKVTAKRTTTMKKSDPYDAGDYDGPDDFY